MGWFDRFFSQETKVETEEDKFLRKFKRALDKSEKKAHKSSQERNEILEQIRQKQRSHKKHQKEAIRTEKKLLQMFKKHNPHADQITDGYPLLKDRLNCMVLKNVQYYAKDPMLTTHRGGSASIVKSFMRSILTTYQHIFQSTDSHLDFYMLKSVVNDPGEKKILQAAVRSMFLEHFAFFSIIWHLRTYEQVVVALDENEALGIKAEMEALIQEAISRMKFLEKHTIRA